MTQKYDINSNADVTLRFQISVTFFLVSHFK